MTGVKPVKHPLPVLRPYQRRIVAAVVESIREGLGRSITVEIARQGGKNELSAQLELFLMCGGAGRPGAMVKCAPTFHPQLQMSMDRLWQRMQEAKVARSGMKRGDGVRFGGSRLLFLSAAPEANVVGHTADLLLEADEAQDIDPDKFDREFRPMGATANVTTVLYGTTWHDRTLLEQAKQANLEAERRDGERRHFSFDWQVVAQYNAAYAGYVENERQRLGETHPLFLTQYCLKPIAGGGRLFSSSQRAQLAGAHERIAGPVIGEAYVAGLDVGGGTSPQGSAGARQHCPHDRAADL